jgi:N-acylneuraminate cytidylyltransferase
MNLYTAFIFARGGSKGIPGKNIRAFQGRPLIEWSIKHAKAIERINRVIVSTDSIEIAEIARNAGAEVPFMRPAYLATDASSELDAWKHALNYLADHEDSPPPVMISVPTTSPLRSISDIERCIDEFELGQSDIVLGITEPAHNPFFNMVVKTENEHLELVNSGYGTFFGRQNSPKVYAITTVCYVAKTSYIMSSNSILEGQVSGVLIPSERSIDIDTQLDFEIAEFLASKMRMEPN